MAEPSLKGPSWNLLQRYRVMPLLRRGRDSVRGTIRSWINAGCPSPAPTTVKINVVKGLVANSGVKRFVETGTFLGNTVDAVSRLGIKCHTIELDPAIHASTKEVLSIRRNIDFILGDAGIELPKLLKKIDEPTAFWLDGHYSGGVTGQASQDTPVSAELSAILDHPVKQHIILIDDARLFDGSHDYPPLSAVLAIFDQHSYYRAEVSTDIIRILPR